MKSKILPVILTISLIANIILAVLLFQTDSVQEISEPTSPASVALDSSYPEIEETWIEPISLYYDATCLIKTANCSDLGQAQIGISDQTVRARIFPIPNDSENVEIRFYVGEEEWVIPRFKTASFIEANSSWFGLKLWYNSGSSVYIATSGGHEGYPEYFVSHLGMTQPKWEKFEPWSYIKEIFPDTTQPPFSVEVGSQYIRLTEENYCCDTVHSDTPERNANRMMYVLKQEYNEKGQPIYMVVDQGSTPR